MSDQPSSAASEQNTQSPGAMLRAARERKGLGIEQVATQLNLRPTLVSGMENDQYDQLRIPAYRRGYLRAYARLLEIDPAPVLKAHDANHSTGEEPMKAPPTPLKPIKRPGRLGKATFRLISIIIVVVLIALMVLWWKGHSGTDFSNTDTGSDTSTQQIANGTSADQPVSSDQTTTTGQSQPVENANVQNSANGTGSNDQQPDTANDNTSAANAGDTGNDQAQNAQQSDNGMRVQVGQGVDGSQMTASEAEAMHRNADNQQPAQGNQSQAQTGQQNHQGQNAQAQADTPAKNGQQDSQAQSANSIQLTFNQDSWTRITDANGKRVLNGLQRAGSQQTVNGQPPFHLTVGNSHGVAVIYKGQPVNLGSRTVAHINLGN